MTRITIRHGVLAAVTLAALGAANLFVHLTMYEWLVVSAAYATITLTAALLPIRPDHDY